MAFDNSSATRRVAFEDETLEEWAIEISMAILREARQSRLKMCQIPPFLSPHSIFAMVPWETVKSMGVEDAMASRKRVDPTLHQAQNPPHS